MSRKTHNRHDRIFGVIIGALCLCALVLVLAIWLQGRMPRREQDAVLPVLADATPEGTVAPLRVVSSDTLITATAAPQVTPQPTQNPQDSFEFLPVYNKGETRQKMIAITLDDCSYLPALKYATKAAEYYRAKLTLLPIATHLLQQENSEALQYCVFKMGFQVENRTLNNSTLYGLDDFNMAREVWAADTAVDYALGKDYSMHLLRTKGGQGLDDPRTHAYLKQLGYDGLLTWSVSGTAYDLEQLKDSLAPGNIYLFNCTKDDVIKLAKFMEFAQKRGYEMVTVNELLGFAPNDCTEPEGEIMARVMPELADFTPPLTLYTEGDRSNGVYNLQLKLKALGYLTVDISLEGANYLDTVLAEEALADGVFGEATSAAIIKYQAAKGLPCTGVATIDLQKMIDEDYERLTAGKQ